MGGWVMAACLPGYHIAASPPIAAADAAPTDIMQPTSSGYAVPTRRRFDRVVSGVVRHLVGGEEE